MTSSELGQKLIAIGTSLRLGTSEIGFGSPMHLVLEAAANDILNIPRDDQTASITECDTRPIHAPLQFEEAGPRAGFQFRYEPPTRAIVSLTVNFDLDTYDEAKRRLHQP